jgi:hypothetical protein
MECPQSYQPDPPLKSLRYWAIVPISGFLLNRYGLSIPPEVIGLALDPETLKAAIDAVCWVSATALIAISKAKERIKIEKEKLLK